MRSVFEDPPIQEHHHRSRSVVGSLAAFSALLALPGSRRKVFLWHQDVRRKVRKVTLWENLTPPWPDLSFRLMGRQVPEMKVTQQFPVQRPHHWAIAL